MNVTRKEVKVYNVSFSSGPAKKFPQYLGTITSTLGAFSLGTSLAWTSPVQLENESYINNLLQGMTDEEIIEAWSWIGACMPMGAALMAVVIGYFMEKFGRKNTMLALVIPFCIGWGLIIRPNNIEMLYAGRLITGMAGGAFAATTPAYSSEIAQKEIRGALGSYFQIMLCFGVLFVYILGGQVSALGLSIICGIVPLIFGASFIFMPETPEYLISINKLREARKSLQFFRGKNYDVNDELKEIQERVEKVKSEKVSFMESFKTKAAKKSLLISVGLIIIVQLSGVNAVIFYTGDIFAAANKNSDANMSSIIVGFVQAVSTFASSLVVDKIGRKILLFISAVVMCLYTMLLGIFFYLKDNDKDISSITWLPLVSLCLFIIAFSIGFGPVPWLMLGELFHRSIKEVASSIACFVNWSLAFLVTKFYAPISQKEGTGATFFIFMSILACGTVFVLYFVKETKGKSPEEIQKELAS